MKNQRVLEYDKGEKINKSTGSRHYWKIELRILITFLII